MSFLKVIGQSLISTVDKPVYDVVSKVEGMEERRYKAAKWVSITITSKIHEDARNDGVKRLFKYILGENEKGSTVAMTSPVITKVEHWESPEEEEGTFTVSFYLPVAHQEKPLTPKDPEIKIEEFPEMTIFSTSFGGFAKDVQFLRAKEKLTEMLKDRKVRTDAYYTVGYDSPMKLINRTNEVWLIKDEDDAE